MPSVVAVIDALMLSTLGKIFSRHQIGDIFLIFSQKTGIYIVSIEDKLHEMSNPIVLEK